MKDLGNPNYVETTLAESRFNMEGLTFELRAVSEIEKHCDPDEVRKMMLSVSTRIEGNNGIACIQQDFLDSKTVKRLGLWLIENADKIFDKTQ